MEILALILAIISLLMSTIGTYILFKRKPTKEPKKDKYADFRDPETGLLRGKHQ